jgi:hypothetical protein
MVKRHVVLRAPDAVVVPTVRPGDRLRNAIRLAEALGTPLVALRSRQPTAQDTGGTGARVPVHVLDLEEYGTVDLPAFETDALLRATPFHLNRDISLKRNLALALARRAGWSRIFFLDDDIEIGDPVDVRRAVGLLDSYPVAGLAIEGFPDGAVASHAMLAMGATARRTISGGALAVRTTTPSFFPAVYNEDLCYLLHEEGTHPSAVVGRAWQEPYDPFEDAGRAAAEEFGEAVIGGLHYLVAHGYRPADANADYWRVYLDKRDRCLKGISDDAAASTHTGRREMLAALAAARQTLALIVPSLCASYVRAWLRDRTTWHSYLHASTGSTRPDGRAPTGRELIEAR